jgi:hypothetical protein
MNTKVTAAVLSPVLFFPPKADKKTPPYSSLIPASLDTFTPQSPPLISRIMGGVQLRIVHGGAFCRSSVTRYVVLCRIVRVILTRPGTPLAPPALSRSILEKIVKVHFVIGNMLCLSFHGSG